MKSINFPSFKKYSFIVYLIKFISVFSISYFGTIALIGLAAPGGHYSPIIDRYFNYVSWLRYSLLQSAKAFLYISGFDTYLKDTYTLRILHGLGVHIGYDCLGYGVLSFWAAFILANEGTWIKKAKWLLGGLLLIWFINVLRISFLLIAINKQWGMPLGFDHHTWFNIAAYLAIFTMMWFFDAAQKKQNTHLNEQK